MISHATTAEQLSHVYPVVRELRPHLEHNAFVDRAMRQAEHEGYRIVYLDEGESAAAFAGYRFLEHLAWGKTLYVDDLCTHSAFRGHGHARTLLEWLEATARREDCDELHLDSGHHRYDAHRLYLKFGLRITSHHFSMQLG